MSYDDVEIEDMQWSEELNSYTYPCPCGDLFQITKEDLRLGEEIARCPSCSLYITVIYNMEDFQEDQSKNKPKKIEPVKQQQPLAVA
ncbi:diphthamide biosynthesis protein 3-like [Mercurialis annua]|uniref:diphthamide biosynthesis protein 3-like n=1 Tax=Mercurialis annua TaxID=3986 RepID=UPI00215F0B45|nr:diphthamide biosynthesis protein 3-like [Mercurialis annua]